MRVSQADLDTLDGRICSLINAGADVVVLPCELVHALIHEAQEAREEEEPSASTEEWAGG